MHVCIHAYMYIHALYMHTRIRACTHACMCRRKQDSQHTFMQVEARLSPEDRWRYSVSRITYAGRAMPQSVSDSLEEEEEEEKRRLRNVNAEKSGQRFDEINRRVNDLTELVSGLTELLNGLANPSPNLHPNVPNRAGEWPDRGGERLDAPVVLNNANKNKEGRRQGGGTGGNVKAAELIRSCLSATHGRWHIGGGR